MDIKLSSDLRPIFDFEISIGNEIVRVDEPAGTSCPLAVVFKSPIVRRDVENSIVIEPSVFWHQNPDPHYEVAGMGGFASSLSKQYLYGPML